MFFSHIFVFAFLIVIRNSLVRLRTSQILLSRVETFRIPEWNWVVLLANIKVLANGATTCTVALRRKLVRLTVFAVPGTKYFGAA